MIWGWGWKKSRKKLFLKVHVRGKINFKRPSSRISKGIAAEKINSFLIFPPSPIINGWPLMLPHTELMVNISESYCVLNPMYSTQFKREFQFHSVNPSQEYYIENHSIILNWYLNFIKRKLFSTGSESINHLPCNFTEFNWIDQLHQWAIDKVTICMWLSRGLAYDQNEENQLFYIG